MRKSGRERPKLSLLYFIALVFALLSIPHASQAQLVNGQFFTDGLAISDAPAPNGQHTVGGTLPIAIDISGNGKLPQSASLPDSTLPTAFVSLNIFLVSNQANVNVTVSSGAQLLTGEQGSTVKHLNWPIPSCLPAASYNFTYYEVSRINSTTYFSITPIPIQILNPGAAPTSACDGATPLEPQPQASSPPDVSPFLDPNAPVITSPSYAEPTATFTVTQGMITSIVRVTQTVTAPAVGATTLAGATTPAGAAAMPTSTNRLVFPVNGATSTSRISTWPLLFILLAALILWS